MVCYIAREKSSPRDEFISAHGAMRKTARFVSLAGGAK
jgi:hypothetical protein